MYFKYGNYQHPDNEVSLSRVEVINHYSRRGQQARRTVRLHLLGELITQEGDTAAAQAALKAAIDNIVAVYSEDGFDAGLYTDAGVLTAHSLNSAASLTGTRVVYRSWPTDRPGEFVGCRTFSIILEADYLGSGTQILQWNESIRIIGNGGPEFVADPTLNAPVWVEQIWTNTTVIYIQSGEAIGLLGYVTAPDPIFPALLHPRESWTRPSGGTWQGNSFTDYKMEWFYVMESPVFVGAVPGQL